MWIAIFAAFFSFAPLFTFFVGVKQIFSACRNRKMSAANWGGVVLIIATLTGRWWLRYLRPAHSDEPMPLIPARRGTVKGRGGVSIEWEEFGSPNAPAVMLAHGWSLTHDSWYYQKKALSKSYRVIVWDMRGMGRSGLPEDHDYSIEALLDDFAAVFDATEAARHPLGCVLVGHSIGAMLLPLFHAKYPERIKSVRGLAMLAGTDMPLLESMRGRRLLMQTQKSFWEPLAHTMARWPQPFESLARALWQMGAVHLALMYGLHRGRESRGQDDMVARHCAFFSMRAAGLGALSCFYFDARAAMPLIEVPVLLMTGDCDVNCPPGIQYAMAARLKNPEVVILPNCGHLNILECHREVNDQLRRFAEKCFGS